MATPTKSKLHKSDVTKALTDLGIDLVALNNELQFIGNHRMRFQVIKKRLYKDLVLDKVPDIGI